MMTLARLISRLNADHDPDAMLQIVCDETAHILGVTGVVAGAYDEQRRMIRYVATCGCDLPSVADLIPQLQQRLSARETLLQILWLGLGLLLISRITGGTHLH